MNNKSKWIQFIRHYGPVPKNDNMYDETIQRSARQQEIASIAFEHLLYPFKQKYLENPNHRRAMMKG